MKKFNEDQKAKEKEEKRRAEEKKKEEKERGKKGGGGAPPPSTSSTPGSVFGVHGPNGCSEGEVSFVTHCLAWLEESGRGAPSSSSPRILLSPPTLSRASPIFFFCLPLEKIHF